MTPKELKNVLSDHKAWLRCEGGSRAYLRGADLGDADLRDAYLRGAHLRGAYLRGADLGDADLCSADLRGADLRDADLRGADLRYADLRGADLRDAELRGAKIAWQSHDLISELLRRAAGYDVERRKIAGLVLVSRDLCWRKFLALEDAQHEWALGVLRKYVRVGDGAPECLLT